MSTNEENFPQIPTAQELLAEVREREANGSLSADNAPEWDGQNIETSQNHDQHTQVWRVGDSSGENQPDSALQAMSDYRDSDLLPARTGRRRPTFEAHMAEPVSVGFPDLLKAYASFTAEQTLFLEQGTRMIGDQYTQAVLRYSKAQSALVRAQADALRQMGVL